MRRLGALLACAVLAGCGGSPAPDLFEVRRTGSDRNANLTLLVSDDGTVTCNGRKHPITGDQLLEARALARELSPQAELNLALPPGPNSVPQLPRPAGAGRGVVRRHVAPAPAVVQQADRVHRGRQRERLRDLAPLIASSASTAPSIAARSDGSSSRDPLLEDGHAPAAAFEQQVAARRGRGDERGARVVRVRLAGDEPGGLQRRDDPRHRRRADLLGLGEPPERQRAAEHDDATAPRAAPAGAPPRRPRGARRAAGGSPPSGVCRPARHSIALLPILDGPRRIPSDRSGLDASRARRARARQRPRRARRVRAPARALSPPARRARRAARGRCGSRTAGSGRARRRRQAQPGCPRRRRLHAAAPRGVLRRRGSRARTARHGRERGCRRREHLRRPSDPLGARRSAITTACARCSRPGRTRTSASRAASRRCTPPRTTTTRRSPGSCSTTGRTRNSPTTSGKPPRELGLRELLSP